MLVLAGLVALNGGLSGVIVHVFGPVAVEGLGLIVVQFEDHPPKVPVLPAG